MTSIRATRAPALSKEAVAVQETKALSFLSKIESLLAVSQDDEDVGRGKGSFWIFGSADATALDAHVVPFIARLLDVGREAIFADKAKVRAYAQRAFETDAWKDVMQGRKTVYGTYL